ncbi:MAG: hypothetical protein V2I67_07855 [Thermoanaerobaculales bacterium]|jgi:hypothetical protein|nr:hypothetical protein [Thermoanaerobaculales bacterium]
MPTTTHGLTEAAAARAWALAHNTLDPAHLVRLLHKDVRIASQTVLEEMVGPDRYLEYLNGTFATFKRTGTEIRIELGETAPYPMAPGAPRPCAIAHRDGHPEVTVLFQIEEDKIRRIDLCMIPPPQSCKGSGVSPDLDDRETGGA